MRHAREGSSQGANTQRSTARHLSVPARPVRCAAGPPSPGCAAPRSPRPAARRAQWEMGERASGSTGQPGNGSAGLGQQGSGAAGQRVYTLSRHPQPSHPPLNKAQTLPHSAAAPRRPPLLHRWPAGPPGPRSPPRRWLPRRRQLGRRAAAAPGQRTGLAPPGEWPGRGCIGSTTCKASAGCSAVRGEQTDTQRSLGPTARATGNAGEPLTRPGDGGALPPCMPAMKAAALRRSMAACAAPGKDGLHRNK